MKAREYLVSKGLAKEGRGRLSAAAKAELERAVTEDNMTFEDYKDGAVQSKVQIKPKTAEERKAAVEKSNAKAKERSAKSDAKQAAKSASGKVVEAESDPIYSNDAKFFVYRNGKRVYTSNRNICFVSGVSVQYCPCVVSGASQKHKMIVDRGYEWVEMEGQ